MKQLFGSLLLLCAGCHSAPADLAKNIIPSADMAITAPAASNQDNIQFASLKIPPAGVILGKKQIPVLCYHQIRDWRPTDSKVSRTYIVPPSAFALQIRMLADSGYHSISPDQLYAYLLTGAALPSKPIMLTFDDTDLDQYTIA